MTNRLASPRITEREKKTAQILKKNIRLAKTTVGRNRYNTQATPDPSLRSPRNMASIIDVAFEWSEIILKLGRNYLFPSSQTAYRNWEIKDSQTSGIIMRCKQAHYEGSTYKFYFKN